VISSGFSEKVQERFFDPKNSIMARIQRQVRRQHWLRSRSSGPARSGFEGQGLRGPAPRLRDHVSDRRGKTVVNAIIDLPFALPTIVAGLTLLALYGPTSPVGIDVAFSRTAIVLALMFVTLPFVVRTVQPVLQQRRGAVTGRAVQPDRSVSLATPEYERD
jgi:hypothetical protein